LKTPLATGLEPLRSGMIVVRDFNIRLPFRSSPVKRGRSLQDNAIWSTEPKEPEAFRTPMLIIS
jgi:hypothetical protein